MILLIHHADALSPAVDPMRPLSSVGLAGAARVAEGVAVRGAHPDVIWHSGKLRARQTAEAFWRACNPLATMTAVRGLQPDDPPSWMRDQLAGEERTIAVVGHMPHLPRLLAMLVSGSADLSGPSFPLHGCVALEPDGDRWREVWRIDG